MGIDPAMVVHAKAMGAGLHLLRRLRPGAPPRRRRRGQVVEREYPLLSAKEVNAAIKARLRRKLVVVGACIGTDAHTVGIDAILNVKGFAGEKGLEYYREMRGGEPRRPGRGAGAGGAGPRRERADAVLVSQVVTQRDAHLHNTREMAAAFREALPAGAPPAAGGRRPAVRRVRGGRARRRPGLRPGHDARRGRLVPRARSRATFPLRQHRDQEGLMSDPRLGLTVTHRRYVPYAHAHYAGNLVDGAYSLGLFGDVATEVCIRTDGDEGLFASYSDVQFLAPVRAGDVLEVTARVVRVGRRSREIEFAATVVCRGRPDRGGERRRGARPAAAGDDGPRHGGGARPCGLKRDTPCDTPVQNAFTRSAGRPDTASMTCDDGESGRSRAP